MSFEGVVCPEDGARGEGITQVESNTFYCSHHKGLFKYVDPGRIKTRVEEIFCACGNRVEFQCQICRRPICGSCDVIAWQTSYLQPSCGAYGGDYIRRYAVIVPSPSCGYSARVSPYISELAEWSVDDGVVVTKPVGSNDIGPFLHVDDILPQFPAAVEGTLRHLCCSCLIEAAPGAAGDIISGVMCEVPGCAAAVSVQCRCCHGKFCEAHVALEDQKNEMPLRLDRAPIDAIPGKFPIVLLPYSVFYYGPRHDGLCGMCCLERAAEAEKEILRICDTYPGLSRYREGRAREYRVPGQGTGKPSDKKIRKISEGCGALIRQKVSQLEAAPGDCRRDQWLADMQESAIAETQLPDGWLEREGMGRFIYRVNGRRER